jgi:hypothetical protein
LHAGASHREGTSPEPGEAEVEGQGQGCLSACGRAA